MSISLPRLEGVGFGLRASSFFGKGVAGGREFVSSSIKSRAWLRTSTGPSGSAEVADVFGEGTFDFGEGRGDEDLGFAHVAGDGERSSRTSAS